MTTETIRHHADCDGYRVAHIGEVVRLSPPSANGDRMRQAKCRHCPWTGDTFGAASVRDAEKQASAHTQEVPCDGRCREWR